MIDAERRADGLGLEIKGVMHSHPTTEPWPSATDVSDAERFDPLGFWWSVIVSLATDPPIVRCFRITAGSVEEEPIDWR